MSKLVPETVVYLYPFCGHELNTENFDEGFGYCCDEVVAGEPADTDYYEMAGIPYTVEN